MFYSDLPWYIIPIWVVAVLAVFLPLYGIPAIGITALIRAWKQAKQPVLDGVPYSADLGLTMADGGEKVDEEDK
jgi:hypothetical protein